VSSLDEPHRGFSPNRGCRSQPRLAIDGVDQVTARAGTSSWGCCGQAGAVGGRRRPSQPSQPSTRSGAASGCEEGTLVSRTPTPWKSAGRSIAVGAIAVAGAGSPRHHERRGSGCRGECLTSCRRETNRRGRRARCRRTCSKKVLGAAAAGRSSAVARTAAWAVSARLRSTRAGSRPSRRRGACCRCSSRA